MKINIQAPLVARNEIIIQTPPEEVWKILTDIDNWNKWQPGVVRAKLNGPLATHSVFHWKSGGLKITSTLQVVEPNRQIGWTGKALGTKARHLWVLKPYKNGTQVMTEESMDGWLAGIIKLVRPGFLEDSLKKTLKNLREKSETETRVVRK
jgi:uncharacterized protein YndB with AHSA1/START domain